MWAWPRISIVLRATISSTGPKVEKSIYSAVRKSAFCVLADGRFVTYRLDRLSANQCIISGSEGATHVWLGGIGCTFAGREAFGTRPRGGGAAADAIVWFKKVSVLPNMPLALYICSSLLVICYRVGSVPCSRWLLVVCMVEAWSFFGSSTGLGGVAPASIAPMVRPMYQVPHFGCYPLMARGSMYSKQPATSPRHPVGCSSDLSQASSIVTFRLDSENPI